MIERMIGWSPISNCPCNDHCLMTLIIKLARCMYANSLILHGIHNHHHSLCVVLKVKLTDCSAHTVLSVKAVMVTVYSVTASRPDRVPRVSVMSPTANVPFCQSMRYMKDHMSGVVGRSHCTSTLGGTGLASLGLRGGPGQAVVC